MIGSRCLAATLLFGGVAVLAGCAERDAPAPPVVLPAKAAPAPQRRTFTAPPGVVVSMRDLAQAEAASGREKAPYSPAAESLPTPKALAVPWGSAEVHTKPEGAAPHFPQGAPPPPPEAPQVATSFLALDDDDSTVPPDTFGGVGPAHVMTTLNTQVRVQTRDGTVLSTVSLDGFWASVGAPNAFDPKVVYDASVGRWFFTACGDSHKATSSLLIATSQSSDPTLGWTLSRIDYDSNDVDWIDYPSIGLNKTWVAIDFNAYAVSDDAYHDGALFLLDKADLVAGTAIDMTLLTGPSVPGTLSPAHTYDDIDELYLVTTWNSDSNGLGVLRVYQVSGQVGTEVLSPRGYAAAPGPWANAPDNNADFAPQLGSAKLIRNNDDRIRNVVFRNGSLWTTHTIFLPSVSPTRASAQWWQIATDGAVVQRGRIDDPGGAEFFAFPSIAVNQANDVLIGYSRFSATQYASANYAFRKGNDPPDTVQADVVLKAGQAPYYKVYSSGKNRWGDYSATVVDPVDDTAMWTLQEYAEVPSGNKDKWGTWWGRVVPVTCAVDGSACDDGDACTLADVCQLGVCVGGSLIVCPDDPCGDAIACDHGSGVCTYSPKPDGTACDDGDPCTQTDACEAGLCVGTEPLTCPATDVCHEDGACDSATGLCEVKLAPDDTVCDDGDTCTEGDHCVLGACQAAPVSCGAPAMCHLQGTCDPETGLCDNPVANAGSPCDDGDSCTLEDACQDGVCRSGKPRECAPKDACHAAGACDPSTGECGGDPLPDGTGCDGGKCEAGNCVLAVTEEESGCGCRVPFEGRGPRNEGFLALALGSLALAVRRRRRR